MIDVIKCDFLKKGRICVHFDNGTQFVLYRSEARAFRIEKEARLTEENYQKLLDEVVTKRAKKRAMYLLERMDRTESQLREKLKLGGYPEESIDAAIAYVKKFHYLDDYRYACTFVRYSQEKMSRQQMRMKLGQKGISRELIESALNEEYRADEQEQIFRLLQKRHFVEGTAADDKEFRRTYQYLIRRGFRSNDILKAMKK